jgi:hypothetical protein
MVSTKKNIGQLILCALFLVTIIVDISTSDVFNLPKFMMLVVFCAPIFVTLIFEFENLLKEQKILTILITVFTINSILVTIFGDSEIVQQLFGTYARNTGFLAYLSFSIILIASAHVANLKTVNNFFKLAFFVNLILNMVSFLQITNLIIPQLRDNDGTTYSLLGNRNFYSALIGCFTCLAFALLITSKMKNTSRFLLFILVLTNLYFIYRSQSLQGFIVALIGTFLIFVIRLYKSNLKKLTFAVISAGTSFLVLFFLALLNIGPLKAYVFGATVTDRVFCMSTGIKMGLNYPVFGVGFDGYFDKFRTFRTLEMINTKGANETCDTAHNTTIDIFASGGFPLLFVYLGINLLVVYSIFRLLKDTKEFNPYMVGLIGFWIAFQAQAFISINQIGVAIWGFVCSGLIIGLAKQNHVTSPNQSTQLQRQNFNSTKVVSGFIIGILVITPLYSVVTSYKRAYAQQDADALLKSLEKWPYNANNMAYAADQLRKNKLYEYSYIAAKRTIQVFPNYYDAYRILYNLEITPEDEKLMAKNQMIRLDPLNSNFD